jgi:alpha-galactosidase
VHLRAGGVSLLLDARGPGLPSVLHWGADLGHDVDAGRPGAGLRAGGGRLGAGRPGAGRPAAGAGGGLVRPPRPVRQPGRQGLLAAARAAGGAAGRRRPGRGPGRGRAGRPVGRGGARAAPAGLLRVRPSVRNDGQDEYVVQELACVLPVPDRAAGAARPDRPVAARAAPAAAALPARRLRPRAAARPHRPRRDAAARGRHRPASATGAGEVWAVHLGWSGDSTTGAERSPALRPSRHRRAARAGEVRLAPGEALRRPVDLAAYSSPGLDGLSDACTTGCGPGRTTRGRRGPVVLNTGRPSTSTTGLPKLLELAERRRPSRRALRARRRVVPRPARRHPGAGRLGRSTARSGRTGCSPGASGSPASACPSACGSSRRWSAWTPTWPASTPSGCSGSPAAPRRPGGSSRSST